MRRRRRLKRPYDWQIDWPEFALPPEGHVHRLDTGKEQHEPTKQARGATASGTEQGNTDDNEGSTDE